MIHVSVTRANDHCRPLCFGAPGFGLVPRALTLMALLLPGAGAVLDVQGVTESGAHFRFMIPDAWMPANGLVVWNHGFSMDEIAPVEDMGPLVNLQLDQGFAVAASSYSQPGWAVFNTVVDLREMIAEFERLMGTPETIVIYGASLGGLVTVQALRELDLPNLSGALTLCGGMAGSLTWDYLIDLRLIYDVHCQSVPLGQIPGGATGLPANSNFSEADLASALNACTGVLLPPDLRTDPQMARLEAITQDARIPEQALLIAMGIATFGLQDLVFDPNKFDGAQPMQNAFVDYGDPNLNGEIERVDPDPEARMTLFDQYTPYCDRDTAKLISIHTDGDGVAVVEQEAYYDTVSGDDWLLAVVIEDTPSHCAFHQAEVVAAWNELITWIQTDAKPTASDLQVHCDGLVATGTYEGPCRYDPAFVPNSLASRIRPRLNGIRLYQAVARWGNQDSVLCGIPAPNITVLVSFLNHEGLCLCD